MKGQFITFEGGEGSGKTTQSKLLYEHLISQGIKCLWTREVGGTPSAELIRAILLHQELLSTTEILLIMAARFEHVEKIIKPAIKAGKTVICDRFLDSTMSYQDRKLAFKLHQEIFDAFMPDVTFFIDLKPDIALNRAMIRGDVNKFEAKDLDFHLKVYNNFQCLAQEFEDRIIVVDGSHTKDEVHNSIKEKFDIAQEAFKTFRE